ncbi:NAD(P)-binding domain-containing protein [Streptomyces sp. NPDC059080]|uniref:NAD(P)-binding domain-containing protein n=1 Tax=Streptomyces sp. NPDC059080 TaxID=3346718 RepID=UPI0036CFBD01
MDDLVVVGAGPYGLSIAAHAAAAGLRPRILGRPMAAWRDHMPGGMYLTSAPWSSDLSDPAGTYTLAAYCGQAGIPVRQGVPLPGTVFTAYGRWFGERAVPQEVEERAVTAVRPDGGGFLVETADGAWIRARTVALAVGAVPFARRPEPLYGLPAALASHSSDHRDLSGFAGRDVTVVGCGQSALETAVLLAELGARARVVARAGRIHWEAAPPPLGRPFPAALRAPHSGLGAGWAPWLRAELPWAVRWLPVAARGRGADRPPRPAGAWWLRDRFETAVPVLTGHRVRAAVSGDGAVRLELAAADGRSTVVETEHVIAATGFVPDLRRLRLLDARVREGLRTVRPGRAPELSGLFESSWPGLFFAGPLAAASFGPAMRSVYGTAFTAGRLLRGVRRRLGRGPGGLVIPHPAPGRAAPAAPPLERTPCGAAYADEAAQPAG